MPPSSPDPDDPFAVDLAACRRRQARLLAALQPLNVGLAVLTRPESVLWLTGVLVRPPFAPIAAVDAAGHLTLVVPERQIDLPAAADDIVGYQAKWHSTTRDNQQAASAEAMQGVIPAVRGGLALELAAENRYLEFGTGSRPRDIDGLLFQLRRRKEPDEIRLLCRANEANFAMYETARRIIAPGINELDVYAELHSAAVHALGEPLTYFGQDFRSGARGGPARNRPIQLGELYILDLGVGFRGYHSDNARTFAVGGEPTPEQRRAWQAVADTFSLVESRLRPGTSCRELFQAAQNELDRSAPWLFNHHLGHGVGLAPQEGPHLNPRWDDVLEPGDYVAIEPGLYHESLRHGVRLEQNYLIAPNGFELLTDWPLEL